MTVNSFDVTAEGIGDGGTLSIVIPSRFHSTGQIKVYSDEMLLDLGSDYTIASTPVPGVVPRVFTGTVNSVGDVADGDTWIVRIDPADDQDQALSQLPFNPLSYEKLHDLSAMRDAALRDQLKRAVRFPWTFNGDQPIMYPGEPGQVPVFDAVGNLFPIDLPTLPSRQNLTFVKNTFVSKAKADLTADELAALAVDTLQGVFVDLGSSVLIRDYVGLGAVSCNWFGATRSLLVGSGEAINVALRVAAKLRIPATIDPGNYLIDESIAQNEGFRFYPPPGVTFYQALGVPVYVIAPTTRYVTGQGNTLAVNAPAGSMTITLTAGKGANFTAKSYNLIRSTDLAEGSGHTCVRAEYIYVESIAGDVLTLSKPLRMAYTTAASAEVQNVNLIRGLEIGPHRLIGGGFDAGIVDYSNYDAALFVNCLQPRVDSLEIIDFFNTGITATGCIYGVFKTPIATEMTSNGFTPGLPGFGYATHESGLNLGNIFISPRSARVRHGYTTTQSPDGIGVPMYSKIIGGITSECRGSGWDTHEPGIDIEFIGCSTIGSRDRGHQSRSIGTLFRDGFSSDCLGSSLSIEGTADGTKAYNMTSVRCATGSTPTGGTNFRTRGDVWDSGSNTIISGVKSFDSGGPVIAKGNSAGNTSSAGLWENIYGRRSNQDVAGLAAARVVAGLTGKLTIKGLDVDCANGQATKGFENLSTGTRVRGESIYIDNSPAAPKAALQPGDVFSSGGAGFIGSFGTLAAVGVVSGVIDIRGYDTAYFDVVGEGGANDSLDEIIGGEVGSQIRITAVGPNITVVHLNAKITTSTGANVGLTSVYTAMTLMCVDENVWVQV
jgi:hypothetical protein